MIDVEQSKGIQVHLKTKQNAMQTVKHLCESYLDCRNNFCYLSHLSYSSLGGAVYFYFSKWKDRGMMSASWWHKMFLIFVPLLPNNKYSTSIHKQKCL